MLRGQLIGCRYWLPRFQLANLNAAGHVGSYYLIGTPRLDSSALPRSELGGALRHTRDQTSGRALGPFRYPRGVSPKGRRAAAGVPEATGDGADVDTGRDELGRRVVPELVERRVDLEPVGETLIPLRQRV